MSKERNYRYTESTDEIKTQAEESQRASAERREARKKARKLKVGAVLGSFAILAGGAYATLRGVDKQIQNQAQATSNYYEGMPAYEKWKADHESK